MFDLENGLFKFDLVDYHAVLGLPLTADGKQIRKRYLKIAQKLHPDTCKAKTDQEKRAASQLLSKLVNPAYENLSREQNRKEHQVLLAQIGKRLAAESSQITIASEPARELFQAQGDPTLTYQKLLSAIAKEQYHSLKEVLVKIAHLSELNLIYLMVTQGKNVSATLKSASASSSISTTASSAPATADSPPAPPQNPYLRRGQEYIDKGNYAKAVLELRDGLKRNPNDSELHALLALSYVKQKQYGMGRVHTKKALQLDAKNAIAQECQKLLNQANEGKSRKEQSKKTSGGLFGGLFGGKK